MKSNVLVLDVKQKTSTQLLNNVQHLHNGGAFLIPKRTFSSVGQSNCLISNRSQVRALEGPLIILWQQSVRKRVKLLSNAGAERYGTHRGAFEKNKKKIFATQTVCGICGKPVDFSLKYPHPLSACIDHIIPVAKGGHRSDIDNLQLAHWTCNRQKSDKLIERKNSSDVESEILSNRILPLSMDWKKYRG